MKGTSYKPLWRGVLGGLLGAPLFLIISTLSVKFKLGYVPYRGATAIAALPFLLPIGAFLGAMIGGIIWVFAAKSKGLLSAIMRATIGACFILLVFGLRRLSQSDDYSGLIPQTPIEVVVEWLSYLMCFGVLPGLMARAKE